MIEQEKGTQEVKAKLQRNLKEVRGGINRADERVQRFARAQPLTATFIALSAGFVVGRLLSRR